MSNNKFSDKFKPVKQVMVSAKVGGDSILERLNEQAIGRLFSAHYTTHNTNGETTFNLTTLHDKIVKPADAFVFLPIPKSRDNLQAREAKAFFREMFKAASLFVGTQTKDPDMHLEGNIDAPQKPIILVNHEGCWDPFMKMARDMHILGTVTQSPDSIMQVVENIGDAIGLLEKAHNVQAEAKKLPAHAPHKPPANDSGTHRKKPEFNVCVFCSASTKNQTLIDAAEQLGERIAANDWGLISGLGNASLMGAVVDGATKVIKEQNTGWVGGSNLKRIIEMEGLPKYYDQFWERNDIYTRMQVMIENSQAFVIMPGGMGTVQELMALLLLKHAHDKDGQKDYLMHGKPIVVVNQEIELPDGQKKKFWDPLIEMARNFGFEKDIVVVDNVQEAMEYFESHRAKSGVSNPAAVAAAAP